MSEKTAEIQEKMSAAGIAFAALIEAFEKKAESAPEKFGAVVIDVPALDAAERFQAMAAECQIAADKAEIEGIRAPSPLRRRPLPRGFPVGMKEIGENGLDAAAAAAEKAEADAEEQQEIAEAKARGAAAAVELRRRAAMFVWMAARVPRGATYRLSQGECAALFAPPKVDTYALVGIAG